MQRLREAGISDKDIADFEDEEAELEVALVGQREMGFEPVDDDAVPRDVDDLELDGGEEEDDDLAAGDDEGSPLASTSKVLHRDLQPTMDVGEEDDADDRAGDVWDVFMSDVAGAPVGPDEMGGEEADEGGGESEGMETDKVRPDLDPSKWPHFERLGPVYKEGARRVPMQEKSVEASASNISSKKPWRMVFFYLLFFFNPFSRDGEATTATRTACGGRGWAERV